MAKATPRVKMVWTGDNRRLPLGQGRIARGQELYVTRSQAKTYRALGIATDAPPQVPDLPVEPVKVDDLASLREEYQEAIGRRPYMGWGAEQLREKINAYRRRDMRAE